MGDIKNPLSLYTRFMAEENIYKTVAFTKPGEYKIIVAGSLPRACVEQLAGMHILTTEKESDQETTSLIGKIRDQAELNGVINTLYDLHMPIISVNVIP